ncbi:ABC transporter substrate-binding protein [Rathayibacter sp. KR2-224]|uniref:ABC transporter substrate-binding protein n=1 Tax=Rathayibacter sp. KR2-224 TaxID=3400913 RepID=UPI003C099ADB
MKIRHRVVATAVIAVAAISLTACSGGGASNANAAGKVGGTLTALLPSQFKSTYDKIGAAFEKKYPSVHLKFNYQGGDMNQLVMTQLQAGTAPDVLTSFPGGVATDNADNVQPLAAQKRILPLTASWAAKIPEVWKSSFNYKGKTYAYPGALQPLAAIYNKTKLDEMGLKVPTTLDEVYKLCTDAKSKGVYAFAQGLGDAAAGPQMLSFGQNATLIDGPNPGFGDQIASGKATYPDSPWVKQFGIYQKMFNLGCFGDGALGRTREQGSTAVAAGQALGIVDVGAVLASLQTAAPKSSFVIASIPATNDGKSYITALPGYVTTINAKAKNAATAQAFLEFMGTPEQADTYANGYASVPVISNNQYTAPESLKDFAALVADKKFAPLESLQSQVQSALNQGVQSMLLGNDTPKSVAEKMQAAITK